MNPEFTSSPFEMSILIGGLTIAFAIIMLMMFDPSASRARHERYERQLRAAPSHSASRRRKRAARSAATTIHDTDGANGSHLMMATAVAAAGLGGGLGGCGRGRYDNDTFDPS